MQSSNKTLWIFLVVLWSSFAVWEYQVQQWMLSQSDYMVRYDLIILPILSLFTIYAIYGMRNKRKPKN